MGRFESIELPTINSPILLDSFVGVFILSLTCRLTESYIGGMLRTRLETAQSRKLSNRPPSLVSGGFSL